MNSPKGNWGTHDGGVKIIFAVVNVKTLMLQMFCLYARKATGSKAKKGKQR